MKPDETPKFDSGSVASRSVKVYESANYLVYHVVSVCIQLLEPSIAAAVRNQGHVHTRLDENGMCMLPSKGDLCTSSV